MNAQIEKLKIRRFVSKLKKRLRNTVKYGESDHIKKNRKQIALKRYLKTIPDSEHEAKAERREPLFAPTHIDYYKAVHFNRTNEFLIKLRRAVIDRSKRVLINFKNTKYISASAMISFLAEVDNIVSSSGLGRNCISFTHPKNDKVESILKQIGFYDLLGKEKRNTKSYDDVAYWNYASGTNSDAQQASSAMKEIEAKISQRAQRKLYKGFTEAMANSVEHAYPENTALDLNITKWWAFAGIKNNILVVVICDKGIGIPNSLPLTRTEGFIESFKVALKLKKLNDSAMINIAARMGKTRTQQGNRGKGLKDVKSIIDSLNKGSLTIYSNKGYYRYFRNNSLIEDSMKEQRSSVCGTIVEWAIPLDADAQEA